jgi:hypothetical protein
VSDDTRISEIARRHRPVSVQTGSPWVGICVTCDDPMPCDAAHLLAVHEQQATRIAALEGERAAAETALLEILRESCWAWRLTEWRKHSVTAVGTQPTPQEACREIREIARQALEAIGAEAEQ